MHRSFGRVLKPVDFEIVEVPPIPAHERASVESVEVRCLPDYQPFGRKVHIVRDRRAFADTVRESE